MLPPVICPGSLNEPLRFHRAGERRSADGQSALSRNVPGRIYQLEIVLGGYKKQAVGHEVSDIQSAPQGYLLTRRDERQASGLNGVAGDSM